MIFEGIDDFIEWYFNLNPNDPIDMHEAMTIFFNLDTYSEVI